MIFSVKSIRILKTCKTMENHRIGTKPFQKRVEEMVENLEALFKPEEPSRIGPIMPLIRNVAWTVTGIVVVCLLIWGLVDVIGEDRLRQGEKVFHYLLGTDPNFCSTSCKKDNVCGYFCAFFQGFFGVLGLIFRCSLIHAIHTSE